MIHWILKNAGVLLLCTSAGLNGYFYFEIRWLKNRVEFWKSRWERWEWIEKIYKNKEDKL
jgi:hypothetical protein